VELPDDVHPDPLVAKKDVPDPDDPQLHPRIMQFPSVADGEVSFGGVVS
jgi:hypothetical protein